MFSLISSLDGEEHAVSLHHQSFLFFQSSAACRPWSKLEHRSIGRGRRQSSNQTFFPLVTRRCLLAMTAMTHWISHTQQPKIEGNLQFTLIRFCEGSLNIEWWNTHFGLLNFQSIVSSNLNRISIQFKSTTQTEMLNYSTFSTQCGGVAVLPKCERCVELGGGKFKSLREANAFECNVSINTYLWPSHYLYYKVLYIPKGIIVSRPPKKKTKWAREEEWDGKYEAL